jgi:hypothetical protein
MLYPPTHVPVGGFSPYENMQHWYEEVYPKIPPKVPPKKGRDSRDSRDSRYVSQ